jgi:alkylation response protein AidB-like acyl-CoA dehydrogenase
VPVENVLGDVGKGHIIAFNILNVGRFKLGAGCVGGARTSLQNAIAYAKDRKAFGKSISSFGLIREKLAQMAVGIYTGESMVYRTVGMMDTALGEIEKNPETIRKSIEEYAVECSIIKVWGSEMLDMVVDETVQIYGGYGFVEEYPAERAYRDSRVNRIFEGTNEINRLIITGWLLKRAMSGQLALLPAIKKVMDEVMAGPSGEELEGTLAAERKLVENAKKLAMLVAGSASQKYMQKLADQQEIMGAIADMVIEAFAMDSALLRAQRVLAPDTGHGFLWRLYSYWRFEERGNDVLMECRAISLTRDVPRGLGWMLEPIIQNFPRESLVNTLEATRRALPAGTT